MAVFYKITNSMERVIRDWAVNSVARFRGHQAELVGTRFKTDNATRSGPSGALCTRVVVDAKCIAWAQREKRN